MTKQTKFSFTAEQIQSACDDVYKRTAHKYKVQGFRDGKAPRGVIEQQYGDVFFEHAINQLFNNAFGDYLKKNPDVRPITDPDVDVTENGKGLDFNVKIAIQDEFKLGKYKGLQVKRHKIEITDKEVDQFIERLRNDRAREIAAPKGHKIQKGDIAVIDFTGSINGVEFAGGKGTNHELEIGSHSFIDNFEEQLVGRAVGDKIDVRVSFPKEYHAKELAGKPALFKTEIKNILIRELPAVDDNFAKQSSEFNTLAEFKRDIRARLEKQSATECDQINEELLLKAVCDATPVEVHPKLVDKQYENLIQDLSARLAKSGINMETYAMYNGLSLEQFETRQREYAALGAKTGLVLDAIGKKENLHDFDKIIKFIKENNSLC
jgi:trigger factor